MPRSDVIFQHHHWQSVSLVEFVGLALRRQGLPFPPAPQPGENLAGTVEAYINAGRWVAECPAGDGGALCVDRDAPYFLCCVCANAGNHGQWYQVRFPLPADEIEQVLLARPEVNGWDAPSRNWRAPQTVDDLRKENRRHGLAVTVGGGDSN
jgi:hypothetical protein